MRTSTDFQPVEPSGTPVSTDFRQVEPSGTSVSTDVQQLEPITEGLERFVEGIVDALPELIAGVVFLVLAAVIVKAITVLLGHVLARSLADQPVYRQFVTSVVAVFLWFGVVLTFLSIVGLEAIAAALGTATGFVALGIAYALSGMIADVVAGVYLMRDPDFMPGDTVTVGDMTGEVRSIELRKTRFAVEGDTVVRANADIEKRWTKRGAAAGDERTNH